MVWAFRLTITMAGVIISFLKLTCWNHSRGLFAADTEDLKSIPVGVVHCQEDIMNKLWTCPIVFIIGWLSYLPVSFSDYVVHLKSGRQFVTDRYWEENGEIKLNLPNGVLGIPKEDVADIQERTSENPAEKREPTPEAPPAKDTPKKEAEEAKSITPLQECYNKKTALKLKLDEVLAKLREATRNKDESGKERAREEMRRLSEEIYELTDKAKEMNNGKLPDYWWQD
jgi:hypothetical protein